MSLSTNDDAESTLPGTLDADGAPEGNGGARAALEELLQTDARCPFGPRFFLRQLGAFVRERCPDSSEQLPHVDLWVHGEPIAVCHVMAIAPRWVAVAASADHERMEMRTEIIVYESIGRVTISGASAGRRGIGFRQEQRAEIIVEEALSPEGAMAAAGSNSAEGESETERPPQEGT